MGLGWGGNGVRRVGWEWGLEGGMARGREDLLGAEMCAMSGWVLG